MKRSAILLSLALAVLGGCRQAPKDRPIPINAAELAPATMEPGSRIAPVDPAPPQPDLSPEAMKGEAGARAILTRWSDALERKDWATARGLWGHGGADSGLDPESFAHHWQRYEALSVTTGDGDAEGGAGSIYYEVPVTIEGRLRDGRVQHLSGHITLRRVNDVDGSSAEDRAWHISQSAIEPVP